MKYAFAYKAFGSSSGSNISHGIGADEATESSSYSTGTVIAALLGGIAVGAVAMYFYNQPSGSSAPAFVSPPPFDRAEFNRRNPNHGRTEYLQPDGSYAYEMPVKPQRNARQMERDRIMRLYSRSKAGHADAMMWEDQQAVAKLYELERG